MWSFQTPDPPLRRQLQRLLLALSALPLLVKVVPQNYTVAWICCSFIRSLFLLAMPLVVGEVPNEWLQVHSSCITSSTFINSPSIFQTSGPAAEWPWDGHLRVSSQSDQQTWQTTSCKLLYYVDEWFSKMISLKFTLLDAKPLSKEEGQETLEHHPEWLCPSMTSLWRNATQC